MTTTDLSISPAAVEARNDLAIITGVAPESIRIIDPAWSQYLRRGYLIKLSIGRWRAETKISLKDLGVQAKNENERKAWDRVIKDLGKRRLLPEDVTLEHDRAENAARALWERYTLRSPWEDKGRFMVIGEAEDGRAPGWRYDDWWSATLTLQTRYFELRDELMEKLDGYLDRQRAEYAVMGFENYGRLVAAGADVPDDHEVFVADFVKHAMARVPSKDEIFASFKFEITRSFVPQWNDMAADVAASETERQLAAAQSQAERDVIADEARNAKEASRKFWDTVQSDLHARVYDVCVDVLEAIKRNDGELPTRSIVELRNLIKALKELNFWDDKQLSDQMNAIKLMLLLPREDRDGAIGDVMAEIGTRARLVLHEMGRAPARSARVVGIPDSVAELTTVRRARHAAVLAETKPLLPVAAVARRAEASRRVNAILGAPVLEEVLV